MNHKCSYFSYSRSTPSSFGDDFLVNIINTNEIMNPKIAVKYMNMIENNYKIL